MSTIGSTVATSAPQAPTAVSFSTAPPAQLAVHAFGVTDKGKVRSANEDQFLIAELTKAMRVWQTSLPEPKLQVGEERAAADRRRCGRAAGFGARRDDDR